MEIGESGSPCGACKFLRRKCAAECVFAPYFRTEAGPARFAAVHKVFGASNASKLLQQLPYIHRYDAVLTIAYEAQARIRDPVRGCVAHILSLQQQVVQLQAELLEMRALVAAHQWPRSAAVASEIEPPQFPTMQGCGVINDWSSIDGFSGMQSDIRGEEVFMLGSERKRRRSASSHEHFNDDLQQIALMIINNNGN